MKMLAMICHIILTGFRGYSPALLFPVDNPSLKTERRPGPDCDAYYFLQNNKTIGIALYDRSGAKSGQQVYKVSKVTHDGSVTSAEVQIEMFDKSGASIGKSNSGIKCDGGAMMVDMKMNLGNQQTGSAGTMDAKANQVYLEYPSGMKEGDLLKDGVMDLQLTNNGIAQSAQMQVTNRKVRAKEKIVTTPGSWDCFRITYNTRITIRTMGIPIPIRYEATEWFAPGFGLVKSQSRYGSSEIV